jgi:hypothetical protein
MLNTIAGITSRNRKTPNALPTPKSRTPNAVFHICSAITFAFCWDDPGAITRTRSKIFNTMMTSVTSTTLMTGARSGTVTRRKTCPSLAPSTRAASSTSRGMAARPAAMITIANPVQIHTYATMIDGVTRVGPSHENPANGSRKLAGGKRSWYSPCARPEIRNRPSGPVEPVPATAPPCTASTSTPGKPRSVGSMTPASPPPPVVKSTHTVPAMPLGFATGGAAVLAAAGIRSGGIATSPSSAVSPEASVSLVMYPLSSGCSRSSSEGRAPSITPGACTIPAMPRAAAFARPS